MEKIILFIKGTFLKTGKMILTCTILLIVFHIIPKNYWQPTSKKHMGTISLASNISKKDRASSQTNSNNWNTATVLLTGRIIAVELDTRNQELDEINCHKWCFEITVEDSLTDSSITIYVPGNSSVKTIKMLHWLKIEMNMRPWQKYYCKDLPVIKEGNTAKLKNPERLGHNLIVTD